MRSRTLLLTVLVAALALPAAVGASAPPGSSYAWQQPGCAPVSNAFAQPPAWIPIAPAVVVSPGSQYAWVQPGCAPVTTPHAQPPAWIPTG